MERLRRTGEWREWMEERIVELERRLARSEARGRLLTGLLAGGCVAFALFGGARPAATQAPGNTVKAPFQVTDEAGKPLLKVEAGKHGAEVRLFASGGSPVAALTATPTGGSLAVA